MYRPKRLETDPFKTPSPIIHQRDCSMVHSSCLVNKSFVAPVLHESESNHENSANPVDVNAKRTPVRAALESARNGAPCAPGNATARKADVAFVSVALRCETLQWRKARSLPTLRGVTSRSIPRHSFRSAPRRCIPIPTALVWCHSLVCVSEKASVWDLA